jgi:hypothetical protein
LGWAFLFEYIGAEYIKLFLLWISRVDEAAMGVD